MSTNTPSDDRTLYWILFWVFVLCVGDPDLLDILIQFLESLVHSCP